MWASESAQDTWGWVGVWHICARSRAVDAVLARRVVVLERSSAQEARPSPVGADLMPGRTPEPQGLDGWRIWRIRRSGRYSPSPLRRAWRWGSYTLPTFTEVKDPRNRHRGARRAGPERIPPVIFHPRKLWKRCHQLSRAATKPAVSPAGSMIPSPLKSAHGRPLALRPASMASTMI